MEEVERSRAAARIILKSLDDPEVSFVSINAEKPFKYKSGGYHPFYTNFRIGQSLQKTRRALVELMADHIENSLINVKGIIPVPHGATPWAILIAAEMDLPMCTLREQPKDHGIQTSYDGIIKPNISYGVIEDLISTGSSAINEARRFVGIGGQVGGVFSFMSYEWPQATDNFKKFAVEIKGNEHATVFDPLVSFSTLFEEAIDLGIVKDSQRSLIEDWRKSPDDWDIRNGFRQP